MPASVPPARGAGGPVGGVRWRRSPASNTDWKTSQKTCSPDARIARTPRFAGQLLNYALRAVSVGLKAREIEELEGRLEQLESALQLREEEGRYGT
jgi:hypothetical protein